MDKSQETQVEHILSSEMKVMTDAVRQTFLREGPLTVAQFQLVAERYDLPKPQFSDKKTSVGRIRSNHDIMFLG